MTTWTKELDEASLLATKRGYWHIVLFYLLCGLASIPTSLLVFSQVFTNATPDHWCSPPLELRHLNLSEELLRTLTVPETSTPGAYDSCQEYYVDPRALYIALSQYVDERSEVVREGGSLRLLRVRQLTTASDALERKEQISRVKEAVLSVRSKTPTACSNGWTYSTELYSTTLVTKFNLVCDDDWWPRLSNFLFWVGSIFGNFFFGWMSDRYGRRPTILLMVYLEVPLSIMTAFCGDYISYTVLRICCGLFFPALYQQPFILALELMPPEIRPRAGIVVSVMFAGGMCILAFMAYCLRDWFTLSLATSLPFILLYSYYWLIPESPRWLVGRGRVAEAEKLFRNLAKKNGIKLSHGFLLDIHKKVKEEEDALAEATTLASINGHLASELQSAKNLDRRLSNMISFKPINPERDIEDIKTQSIENKLALEVAEIVNKKKQPNTNLDKGQYSKDTIEEDDFNEESQLNVQSLQKSTQTDVINKPHVDTLRRKSIQLVSKMFIKEDLDSDPEDDKKMDDQNSIGDCKATILDIFRYPNIRRKFLLLTFNWVALGVAYNGLSYNTPNLGVDDYLAFFIGGAVEIPSYFLAWKCMDKFGRRWVLCSFLCIGGITCICCMFVPDSLPWVTVTLAMIGRLLTAASFAVFYVLIGELLPTVLRAQAMGAASFVAGIGLLTCPYIVHLVGILDTAVFSKSLPLVIIGTLALMAGVISLFLPETLHQPLPQTLTDGELFGQKFNIFSCITKPKEMDYACT